MWTTNNQGIRYWIPDILPEPSDEYNNYQLTKLYKTPDGIKTHPQWKYDNGSLVDDEYLLINEGWKLLVDTPPNYDSSTHVLQKNDENEWEETENILKVTYTLREKTQEEYDDDKSKRWKEIREIRNEKLKKLDHAVYVAFENSLTLSQKFKDYRQTLRDIPENFDDPFLVIWPDELTQWEYYD